MADPVTAGMAGAGMIASIAGGIVGAEGAEYQGGAQANMYNYQARIAKMNADLKEQQANYAEGAGEVEAQQIGMKGRAEFGRARVDIGAANLSTAGSPGRVLGSITEVTQQNEALTRSNAAERAYGLRVGGATDTAQAGLYGMAAKTSRTAGDIGAVSSILGGVSSVSSKWSQASQAFGSPSESYDPGAFTTSGLYVGSSQYT